MDGEDMDRHLLSHVSWSPNGKFLAGAMDHMLNIWVVAGKVVGLKQTSPSTITYWWHQVTHP